MVAWLELREPRSWDSSSALAAQYDIPLYPATPDGVLQAVRQFLTEQGAEPRLSDDARQWQGLPIQAGVNLDAYLEQLLGDALPWAQDCALLQPISLGLADALRREFNPHLPYERIERLYALPGTTQTTAGLKFSNDVERELRLSLLARRDEADTEKVLGAILKHLSAAEPKEEDEKDSQAHLAWEAVIERVRLELEKDYDLERFAQLAQTPLGAMLSASLENYRLPDQTGKDRADRIPLLVKPRKEAALQRLARVTDELKIEKREAYPVAWGHWLALGLLMIGFFGFSGQSYQAYQTGNYPPGSWEITGLTDAYARLERHEGETWKTESAGVVKTLTEQPLAVNQDYRLHLFGNGFRSTAELKTADYQILEVPVDEQPTPRLCREDFPAIGMSVQVCPTTESQSEEALSQATWRERLGSEAPEGRTMSVGLEISEDQAAFQGWRESLLQTGSVDVLYRIFPDRDNAWHVTDALEQFEQDLEPWIAQSQLVWWASREAASEAERVSEVAAKFSRALGVEEGQGEGGIADVEPLLAPGKNILVSEEEIQLVLGRKAQTDDGPLALVRPLSEMGILVVITKQSDAEITVTRTDRKPPEEEGRAVQANQPAKIEPGKWLVTVQAKGYAPAEQVADISSGETTELAFDLGAARNPFSGTRPGSEIQNLHSGMVDVPAGEFWMGCKNDVDKNCFDDEKPGREVYLDAFWIDPYEVTVADYRRCVEAGSCPDSEQNLTKYDTCNWDKSDRADHPINCVDWNQARNFCKWSGKRLPTEAEWEKAARGTEGWVYPWGNAWDASKANTSEGKLGRTAPVGFYPSGISRYKVQDMAGNVREWVQDWYVGDYYKNRPTRNPRGPDKGTSRSVRGGSWLGDLWYARVAYRLRRPPGDVDGGVGFRCASS